jgi:hypothetical protein
MGTSAAFAGFTQAHQTICATSKLAAPIIVSTKAGRRPPTRNTKTIRADDASHLDPGAYRGSKEQVQRPM